MDQITCFLIFLYGTKPQKNGWPKLRSAFLRCSPHSGLSGE
ncbi:hypothetical protein GCWU000321_00742 [Dialister invisus DSM 15470]|uniref:Uncharacterized protein n=1 Tax=Dialister invisus DSM 15470 TaxID=592028 RepID=C9LMI9_9FIRM|nr:hypothetical protein GCWU000321_00742 [Dialister invisus DSM 15470]